MRRMNSTVVGLLESLAGIAIGVLVSWLFYRKQRRDAEEAARRAEEQHDADQGRIRDLRTEITREQRKQREAFSMDQQRRSPVRVMFDEPLHQQYVARPEVLTELFGRLFTSQSRILVVAGDFGVGKTWAAREFARIASHVAPFQDGLLCATLGPSPAIRAELKKWHDTVLATNLTVADGEPGEPDHAAIESANLKIPEDDQQFAAAIARHLGERRPLVIIDDVWDAADVEWLLAATPDSPRLMTTPRPEVVRAYTDRGAAGVKLTGLTAGQARQLLGAFIEPALPAPATAAETALRKRNAFLDELSYRVDNDPFTVVQAGAFVRDKLGARDANGGRPSWATISERALGEIVRDIAGQPEASPDEATDHADRDQPAHKAGPDVFQVRLDGLRDPVQLAVLRTLSLLRPRPEQFTATEVAAMIIPQPGQESGGEHGEQSGAVEPPPPNGVQAVLDDLADGFYLERTEILVLDQDALPADGSPATRPEFRYSVHNRARRTLAGAISPDTSQAFHQKAVDYWRSWIDPRRPDSHIRGASSYQIAMSRDSADWLRAARNLTFHLRHLDDRALARQTFAAIYFELFFWRGAYLRYQIIEEFVRDWNAESRGLQDPADSEWFAAVMAFHQGYLPGHDTVYKEGDPDWRPGVPEYQGSNYDWPAVTAALETILRTCGLSIPPDQLTQHDQWHVRALIDIFLADSLRYRPPAEARRLSAQVDRYHKEARELIQRCNDYDEAHSLNLACEWNRPWIDWQEADEALRRSAAAEDTAAREAQWRIAGDMTTSAIRDALAGDDKTELTHDRDGLDYELLATACMTRGDLLLARDGIRPAATWYADAAVLARAWLYRPLTDDYTRMFSGHVSENARRALAAAQREAAAGGQAELAAAADAIVTVMRNGYEYQWGARPGPESVDPAVLADPIQFMTAVMGPPLAAGKHDDAVDPIPAVLAQAADRVIEDIWDAVRQAPAVHPAQHVA
jgi:hypothetical protein